MYQWTTSMLARIKQFVLSDIVWLKGWCCAKHIECATRYGMTQVRRKTHSGNDAAYVKNYCDVSVHEETSPT